MKKQGERIMRNFEEEISKLFLWYKTEVEKLFEKYKESMHGLDGCSDEYRCELKALQNQLDKEEYIQLKNMISSASNRAFIMSLCNV